MRRYPRLLACLPLLAGTACASAARPPADPAPEPQPRFEPRIGLSSPPIILSQPPGSVRTSSRNQEPLYVVDGVVQEHPPAQELHDEIVCIRVLKGEEAVAEYGSRAANGVILITTKRGASNPLR